MKIYGIPNCNTVKKALDWLKKHQIEIEFHNFKKSGVELDKLDEWSEIVGWETLINKKGTTWKMLDPSFQKTITSKDAALKLMQEKPSVIKRPLLEFSKGIIILGFDESKYAELIK